jgi:hypothetical protein
VPLSTQIDDPQLGSLSVSFAGPAAAVAFPNTLYFELNEHYLTPCSAFNFGIDEDELSTAQKQIIVPGARVQVTVNDLQQCSGYVDDVDVRCSRGAGTVWHIECREWNSPILDSHIDPKVQFTPTMSLVDVLTLAFATFSPFDFTGANGGGAIQIVTDASANRNVITGSQRGTKTSKSGKVSKQALSHQLKPYQHEGVWAFCSRVSQRFGLWLRPSADGTSIIASTPDFTQDPSYTLQRLATQGNHNNVLDGGIKYSRKNQPSIILACGFGGGGVFPNSQLRAAIVNPVINADVSDILQNYPGVQIIEAPDPGVSSFNSVFTDWQARPLFLYDPESHTPAELQAYLLRELSLRTREALQAHYTIEGLLLGGSPVAVDTIAQVQDDRASWNGPLWVENRSLTKRPGGGTTTKVSLIRPNTMSFGSPA